jgi:hypothetical protein
VLLVVVPLAALIAGAFALGGGGNATVQRPLASAPAPQATNPQHPTTSAPSAPVPATASAPPPTTLAISTLAPPDRYKDAERLLGLLGYGEMPIDGVWGPTPAAALANFQRSIGHPSNGQLDLASLTALEEHGNFSSLAPPSSGSCDVVDVGWIDRIFRSAFPDAASLTDPSVTVDGLDPSSNSMDFEVATGSEGSARGFTMIVRNGVVREALEYDRQLSSTHRAGIQPILLLYYQDLSNTPAQLTLTSSRPAPGAPMVSEGCFFQESQPAPPGD